VLGGPSAEHDVSLVSGRAIAAALAERGHDISGWLVDLDGGWWRLPAEAMSVSLEAKAFDDPQALGAVGPLVAGRALEQIRDNDPVPVVFIALHGPFGEDGTIQALCEAAGLIYTGAGVAASAIGMDKVLFKRLTEGMGMPSVPWITAGAADWAADPRAVQTRLADFARDLPDPRLVVKPSRLGSSIGISIVHHPDDAEYLGGALTDAFGYGDTALIEAYIDHPRELEMSVVGNSPADLEVFGPGEIFSGHEFYDYTAKYSDGVSETTDSATISPQMRTRIHDLAARAFLAIGATGFARVDFMASGEDLYLNEINTIPGFTPISLFPVLCRAGGYDFGAIAERIVELAIARDQLSPRRVLTRADLP
ncbi:MAG TPA: D-alanine--D-alanine ligase family protein, partial [Candidatus Limnocylindrales bacterium]|nr:D-alanine--D-alanine ligase family protein [Candidatus Limnocylindrales bacterium]